MRKMENFNNSHGITLIALTVTIVIMLILSTIVLTTLNDGGENSIESANDAKIYTELKQMKEQLNQYKVSTYSNSQLRAGNFSGEISSGQLALYLKTDGIATEFTNIAINSSDIVGDTVNTNKTNRSIGIINTTNFVQKLNLKNNVSDNTKPVITIGKNFGAYNPTGSSLNNLKQFDDVVAIDFEDETLYYVRDGKIWILEYDN